MNTEREHNREEEVLVIGHRNPDTDSIISAITYSQLKNVLDENNKYIPCRAGALSAETAFVLDYFNVETPRLVENVNTRMSDVEYRKTKGISKDMSLKDAWNIMNHKQISSLPAVTESGMLEGLITMSDITKSYMNMYDSDIIAQAGTIYRNIEETLDAEVITGDTSKRCTKGKVLIAAANPEMMKNYIEEHDIVILGNRTENQLSALDNGADCIIICEGADVSPNIKNLAELNGMIIMKTNHDAYTAARLINQSMPISYFMKENGIIKFLEEDFVEDVKEVMTAKRFRDFPVIDKDGKYLGLVSRRNLLENHGKDVILVDHNETAQSVKGMESANIMEIIDHHRLGTIQTAAPVFFRNQPLGCTATIIYMMYNENGVEIQRRTAGLLLSAIISDTLMFRSPTCTKVDQQVAKELAEIAEINIEEYSTEMFSAASDLKGKSNQEIFYQDYKRFTAGNYKFGVTQIMSLNRQELLDLKDGLLDMAESIIAKKDIDMIFIMFTDIMDESSLLLSSGQKSKEILNLSFPGKEMWQNEGRENSFSVAVPGLVSRKKQLLPKLSLYAEQI